MKYLGVFQMTNNYKKATMFPLVHPNMRPTSRDDDLAQDPTPLFTRSVNPQTHMNHPSSSVHSAVTHFPTAGMSRASSNILSIEIPENKILTKNWQAE